MVLSTLNQQVQVNYVADLGSMSVTIKVNAVSSVIGSMSSLSRGISQLHTHGLMSQNESSTLPSSTNLGVRLLEHIS